MWGHFVANGLQDAGGGGFPVALVVALISLLGVVLTTAVTVLGILLKRSFDQHNARLREAEERRLQLDARHNRRLQQQAEERLRMETVIRAVALLSGPSGDEPPQAQRAGVLFALARLGQVEFALPLLDQMWSAGRIQSASAIWLINEAFHSGDADVQDEAADILIENAEQLLVEKGGFHWPRCLSDTWTMDLTEYARETALEVLLRLLLARSSAEWRERSEYLTTVLRILYLAMSQDKEPRIQCGAALAVTVLLEAFPEGPDQGFITVSGRIGLDDLKSEAERLVARQADPTVGEVASAQVSALVERLRLWVNT